MMKRLLPVLMFLCCLISCSQNLSDSAAGGSGGNGGTGDGGDGNGTTQLAAPTLQDQFTSDSEIWRNKADSPGSVAFNIMTPEAEDGVVLQITLQGEPLLESSSYAGPANSNQISTMEDLSFGIYRTRIKAASCVRPAAEEVINGIFTYSYGGDTNANGITDNNEIDIEIACSMPNFLMLTVWTDYEDDSNFQKVTRMVDMSTGEYYQTEAGKEGEYGVGHEPLGTISGIAGSGFDITKNFYEIGFDWQSEQLRYFVEINGSEITLWDYREKSRIPQNPAAFVFNLWHSDESWHTGSSADYPTADALLNVDWFKYWAQR